MFVAVLVVHVIVSVILVLIVLLQSGRGAELGAAFGGVGQATYGRGRPTFLSKFTTAMAVIFMTTSLSLAFMSNEQPRQSVVAPGSGDASSGATAPVPLPQGDAAQEGAQTVPSTPQTATEAKEAAQQTPLEQTDAPPQEQQR